MKLSWFLNERGSTSLTVVLGVVLSVVLLASSVQWYWTNSTSSDIQAVADLGALAAADVSAKSVMVVQTLDAMLLTANLFGLVIHAVTVVSGLLVVLTAPVGGAGATPFFERIVDFNRRYCEKRRDFARHAYQLADAVNQATPYLAIAQSYHLASENSKLLSDFNGTSYVAIAIPFPARGEVQLTGFSPAEQQILEEVTATSEANTDSAHEIKRLEGDVEAAIDECFRRNTFKPAGVTRPHYNPLRGIDDFSRGWTNLRAQAPPSISGPAPIDNTSQNRDRLQERYRSDYQRIGQLLDQEVRATLNTAAQTEAASVSDLNAHDLLAQQRQQRIYLVDHAPGVRRAYHTRTNCFGLAGSSAEIKARTLDYVMGDLDHPPCLLCAPPHWRALQMWEQQLAEYVQSWNQQAAALRWWYQAQDSIQVEQDRVRSRTRESLDKLREEASSFLQGGRLSYTPAGARGYLCIVMSTSERELPAFTLPALTDSADRALGRQIAMAGARLMPSATESTIPHLLSQSRDMAESSAASEGFAGVTRALMGADEAGSSTAVLGFALQIWGTCLALHDRGTAQLEQLVSGLPFGLDTVMQRSLRTFFETAQITAPDLRKPQPTLVNTADIGDRNAAGFEGGFVRSVAAAKDVLERSGGASIAGIREAVSGMINDLDDQASRRIEQMLNVQVLGVTIPLPFSQQVQNMVSTAFAAVRSKEQELFAALGR
ncbi:MAG: hypothetical protein FWF11_00650 [Coriobacteriia bacterium]|nr:hypothetical protein [Coriobacteriia bacterium]